MWKVNDYKLISGIMRWDKHVIGFIGWIITNQLLILGYGFIYGGYCEKNTEIIPE